MDSASCFSRLNELRLSANLLGDDGVEVLARSPHARHLSVLALDECGISDRGALALINSPYLSQDCALGLRDNPQISDKVAVQLQARFERCKLQRTHKPNSRCLYHVAERASSGVRMWETWRWDPLALVHSEWVEPRSEYWDVEDWLVPVRVD